MQLYLKKNGKFHLQGIRIAPKDAHPAFDVTPARYIAAIFTERGVARAPYTAFLRALAFTPQPYCAGVRS